MNYEGDLYGKVGGMIFKTGKTSKDWDDMEARIKELEAENKALQQADGINSESKALHIDSIVCSCCGKNTPEICGSCVSDIAQSTGDAAYHSC